MAAKVEAMTGSSSTTKTRGAWSESTYFLFRITLT
jgi:hypothetical protein